MLRILGRLAAIALLSTLSIPMPARAVEPKDDEPNDPDFKVQGEYLGALTLANGEKSLGVQVIALGKGKFHAIGYIGGLPGDGWDHSEKRESDGATKDGVTTFERPEHTATIKDGVVTITTIGGIKLGELKKVVRQSATLGAKPPAGAIVLFDGKNPDKFDGGRMTADGLLVQGTASKDKFQSYTLHVEFRLPFMPEARDQARGNSGVYQQGRYEVQVLDSFGLKGENNECGGIYSVRAPDVNMCYPPFTWQTYDVEFTAAKYENGKKVKDAVMSVKHNGVVIHQDAKVPHTTTAAPVGEGPEPGPIYLQDHGNPVRYRNIWLVEKK